VSYTVTLPVVKVPSPDLTALADVTTLPRGKGLALLYRHGVSSRGVEVTLDSDGFHARLTSLASDGDWALAFELLAVYAGDPTTELVGEDGTSGTADAFTDVIARETAAALAGAEAALAGKPGSELSLRGPIREVHIGPRLLGELAEPRADDLIERVRRIQYLESERFEVCAPVPLRAPGIPTFTVWTPTKTQAFEPVDALGLSTPDGNLYIPVAALPALLGARFEWLDEKQFAIYAAEDPALIARARAVSIDPYAATRKKWWQFWRSE
jgi:hypothetical protein